MSAYSELISTLFEGVPSEGKHNCAVAFTSALPEEDVSFVVHALAKTLAARTQKRVVIVDASAFHDLEPTDASQILRQCTKTGIDNLLILSATERAGRTSSEKPMRITGWHSTPQIRQAYLKKLCRNFDYVIIDCPALSASSDVKSLAPIVDGVAVVVGANRKRLRKAQTSQHAIESLGGKFLGYILR